MYYYVYVSKEKPPWVVEGQKVFFSKAKNMSLPLVESANTRDIEMRLQLTSQLSFQ